jgi:lysozyme
MIVSDQGIEFIKQWEGLSLQSYLCPAHIWTIGYGSTHIFGRCVDKNDKITPNEAENQLKIDLRQFEKIVSQNIFIELTQNQFDALVSHTYNTGGSETLFHLINTKSSKNEIRNWIESTYLTANGIILNGLIQRRKMEANLFFENQKSRWPIE